jgi:peptidoglycan hydrolase-like protein with peptidoglycan-binding domain
MEGVTLNPSAPAFTPPPSGSDSAPDTLRLGSRGPPVETLQKQLGTLGENLPANGQFGPRTQLAVQRFQRANNIVPADGVVRSKTARALAQAVQAQQRGGWAAGSKASAPPASASPARDVQNLDASATRSADSQFVRGSRGWELEKKRCQTGLDPTETKELNQARSDPKQSKAVPGVFARVGKFINDEADGAQGWISKKVDQAEKGSQSWGSVGHFGTSVVGGLAKGLTEMVTGTVGLAGKGLELTDETYRKEAGKDLAAVVEHPGQVLKGVAHGIAQAVKDNPGDALGQAVSFLAPGAAAKLAGVGKVAKAAELGETAVKEAGTLAKGVSAERLAEVRTLARDAELQARYTAPPPGARAALEADLSRIPATGPAGVSNALEKFMASPLLGPEQKERVLRAATFAKDFTERTGKAAETAGEMAAKGFQDSNRLHLQDELSVMTDVAQQLKLSPRQAENAYLASIFSDVDKVPGRASLITHHEAGARAAAVRLPELFPNDPNRVAEIVEIVKAHQISPPRFFASQVMGEIMDTFLKPAGTLTPDESKALASVRLKLADSLNPEFAKAGGSGLTFGSEERALLQKMGLGEEQTKAWVGLQRKIADPLNPAHLNPARTGVAFSDAERALLSRVGLKEWAVPSSRESWAVILADGKSNYGKPPHKIYGNRGPGTFFPDQTSEQALESVLGPKGTGADAASVLPAELRPSFEASVDEARAGVERARQKMDGWLKSQGLDPQNTVYWRNTPLLPGASEADVALAKRVRGQFEQFLRKEAGL